MERRHEDIDTSLRRLTGLRAAPGLGPEALLDAVLAELAPGEPEDDIAVVAARLR